MSGTPKRGRSGAADRTARWWPRPSTCLRGALDVGCGEGADAIWLTLHGWDATALDVSHVALERARAAAADA